MNGQTEQPGAATVRRVRSGLARPRRGVGLVFIAICLFILFALGALVVDIGLAWVAQSRMTSVADAAAMETLRWRDQPPPEITTVNPSAYVTSTATPNNAYGTNPTTQPSGTATNTDTNTTQPSTWDYIGFAEERDLARRQAAAYLVNIMVANNVPAQPRDNQFGTGPVLVTTAKPNTNASSSTATLNAGAIIVPGNPPAYKPPLQSNVENNINGDIVVGNYNPDPTVSHQSGVSGGAFSRDDFTVADASDAPFAQSALVRMRHSRDQAVPGVVSSGIPIPFIFAMGSFLPAYENANHYAPRRDGITVRSASIAHAVPAVYAGVPIAAANVQGVQPLAFTANFWENEVILLPADEQGLHPVTVSLDNNVLTSSGQIVGYPLTSAPTTIGSSFINIIGAANLPSTTINGYFPIVETVPSGNAYVIGYGWAQVSITGGVGTVAKLCKSGGAIAPRNASADLRMAWNQLGPPTMTADDEAAVRQANAGLVDPLLAPVLVRAMSN